MIRTTLACFAFAGLLAAQPAPGGRMWNSAGPGPGMPGMGFAGQRMASRGMGAQHMAGQRMAVRAGAARNAQALKEYLGLTDTQLTQIQDLRRQQAEQFRPGAEEMRAKAQELRTLMRSDSPDAARVGALTVEMKKMREDHLAARAATTDKVRALLTPEQTAKLKDLEEAAKLGMAARQAAAAGLIELPRPEAGAAAGAAPAAERGMRMRGRR